MRHFDFKNGHMHCEGVSLSDIADQVGTPVYVYSSATFERHFSVFTEAFKDQDTLVAYSVKANSNIAVLASLAKLGAGADVVSGGELARALKAGIPGEKIVFSGVGKKPAEMHAALTAGIHVFNVESQAELDVLNSVAIEMGKIAPIAFRVNPDVSAGGHEKISTGKAENKFGIAWSSAEAAYAYAATLPGIKVVGVDVHIGSQIVDLAPFETAITKVGGLIKRLRAQGHDIQSFDVGGGLGINYGNNAVTPPQPSEYGAMVKRLTSDMNVKMIFEPGRMIAGNSGVLLSEVVYVKDGEDRKFLIIDAAMNDLIRPALYDAYHDIEAVRAPGSNMTEVLYDVVGPICETGDTFTKRRMLPEMEAGDRLVFHSAGAYGAAQASQYNTRPLVPEVLVRGGEYHVIRARPTVEDILAGESIPDWLDAP
ncbi:diaminopimelate decarboxylase [Fretibacter rubidus]|uniref:diaminopimelate decarboxylase n=1 Tax=Fretibacter rubidus TaxID=570162 RepID=UPI00352B5F18